MFEYDGIRILWIGHASFRIEDSKVIYIDPYAEGDYSKRADIVLVTHEHFDHCDKEKISRISDENTKIIGPKEAIEKLEGIPGEKVVVRPGDEIEIEGIRIKAVPSYNIGKPFHPKGKGVGYVIEMDGKKIYHAGDTDAIPEMREIEVDIALLPIGGTYTMDDIEASEAVKNLIKTKVVIPMHYNYLEGLEKDPNRFKELVGDSAEVVILEPGK